MDDESEIEIQLIPMPEGRCTVTIRASYPGSAGIELEHGQSDILQETTLLNSSGPDEYGRLLSGHLFYEKKVREFFRSAWSEACRTGLGNVRIRLTHPAGPSAWFTLRWETLFDADEAQCLTTDRRVSFFRLLAGGFRNRTVNARPRSASRALVAIASPLILDHGPEVVVRPPNVRRRLSPIPVEEEARKIREQLSRLPHVEFLHETPPGTVTLTRIIEALASGRFDVFYLMCHGGHDKGTGRDKDGEPRRGDLVLYLDKDQASHPPVVPARRLAEKMGELRTLPVLVVLASCKSAGDGESTAGDNIADEGLLAALGPRLARIGVPSVIAMQGNVSTDAVAAFMPKFFAELMTDGRIDRAVSAARSAIRDTHPREFWVPALFCSLKDGRLWIDDRSLPAERRAFNVRASPEAIRDVANHLHALPCVADPRRRAMIVEALPWLKLPATDRDFPSPEDLARAWLAFGIRLGTLPEVLETFEGTAQEIDGLYDWLQREAPLCVGWGALAELKRYFPTEFDLPDSVRTAFLRRNPRFQPPRSLPGRSDIHAWLEDLSYRPANELSLLFDFLSCLEQSRILEGREAQVRSWQLRVAATVGVPCPVFDGQRESAAYQATSPGDGSRRLIVKVQPVVSGRYALRAWFLDGETIRGVETPKHAVKLAEIPEHFSNVMMWCGGQLQKRLADARVELLLPFELLSTAADQWPIGRTRRPVGSLYEVVVRSYERTYDDLYRAEVLPFWADRADRLMAAEPLSPGDVAWADGAVPYELEDSDALVCAASSLVATTSASPRPADVAKEMVDAGYPIAVWARRREPPCGELRQTLGKLLTSRPLQEVPRGLITARREGYSSANESHWGRLITVLWDMPGDYPPDCVHGFEQPELSPSVM